MIRTYRDAIDFIFSRLPMFSRIGPSALKYDLGNIEKLCRHLTDPYKSFPSIHIAGTNGKGTTSHLIASVFQQAGYKTGLYTSPHYKDFRERIKINGKFITMAFLRDFIINNYKFIEEIKPSYFELSVALAFSYFAHEKVDIAIIEVGLGGRLDSTNIITPLLSVITNISLDHTNVLGDSLPEIAAEKAGIFKQDVPVIIGEKQKECMPVYEEKAKSVNALLYYADDILKINTVENKIDKTRIEISTGEGIVLKMTSDLSGPFFAANIKYAYATINVFRDYYRDKFAISDEHVLAGIKKVRKSTKYFGRWNIISKNPYIIADGAHNIDAIQKTFEYISAFKFIRTHIILGLVADKDWENVLKILPQNAEYYFTRASIPRAMDENLLREKASLVGLIGKAFPDLNSALQSAKSSTNAQDLILILGSIYLVGELT